MAVQVRAVPVPAEQLSGLEMAGAWSLSARHPDFGGFSGLEISDSTLVAVSDRGSLLTARIDAAEGLSLSAARMVPLQDSFGPMRGKDHGDAEGLAALPSGIAVSFEREHRIGRLEGGTVAPLYRLPAFDSLAFNGGLEGLAALPDGRLLALAEEPVEGAARYFLLGDGVEEGRLPLLSRHRVTGADIGPDGRLYLVLRDFSRLTGVSIRVMRYALAESRPVADSATQLAAWESASGIDNMEGIALTQDQEGTSLWLISDDNFNFVQRTLLVRLRVVE